MSFCFLRVRGDTNDVRASQETKINKGFNTPDKLINKYAPPHENDTPSYVNHVSGKLGVGPNDKVTANEETLTKLTDAIILHENGKNPYTQDQIKNAVKDAMKH